MIEHQRLLQKQVGYIIIDQKRLKPVHTFYRFKVYLVNDGIDILPEEKSKRLHFQIEGDDVKVVVRFYLNVDKEIYLAKYFRLQNTDEELSFYAVMYWITFLKTKRKFAKDFVLKTLREF